MRGALLLGAASSIYACSHAWDDYAPLPTSSTSSSSTSSSTSGSGDVDGGACSPADTCYQGPAGTEGLGACKGGTWSCTVDGGYGTCLSQVMPMVEDCTVTGDADCDGVDDDHCGVWAYGFVTDSSGSANQAYGMAVTPGSHVLLTGGARGHLYEMVVNDAGPLLSNGPDGVFTIALDPAQAPVAQRYGGTLSVGMGAAVEDDGGALVTGALYNTSTMTVPPLPAMSDDAGTGADLFVTRLGPDGGAWQQLLASTQEVQGNAVAFGAGTASYVGGSFTGQSTFGFDGGLDKADGTSAVLLKLDATGGTAWQLAFGANAVVYTVAAFTLPGPPPVNEMLAGGTYTDASLTLIDGGKPIPGTGMNSGLVLAFPAATSEPLLARAYLGSSAEPIYVDSIAVDVAAGQAVIAGRFGGTVDFGGPAIAFTGDGGAADAGAGCGQVTAVGMADVFVTALSLTDLSCLWVQTFGNSLGLDGPPTTNAGFALRQQRFGPQVAIDSTGSVLLAANYTGTLTLDTLGGWVLPGSTYAIALLKLRGQDGGLSWVRHFGDGVAYATGIGVDANDDIYLAGHFAGTLTIAPGQALAVPPLAGHEGMFVAQIAH